VTVHLVKLAVGIEDPEHLARVQQARLKAAARGGKPAVLRHLTRHRPKQAEAIVSGGGSLYWVIGGAIAARQRILGFEEASKADGTPAHAILLDPRLIRTEAKSFRPFQGWRYLPAGKIPRDLGEVDASTQGLPADLRKELKGLGLI
jgi:hypothetical protein